MRLSFSLFLILSCSSVWSQTKQFDIPNVFEHSPNIIAQVEEYACQDYEMNWHLWNDRYYFSTQADITGNRPIYSGLSVENVLMDGYLNDLPGVEDVDASELVMREVQCLAPQLRWCARIVVDEIAGLERNLFRQDGIRTEFTYEEKWAEVVNRCRQKILAFCPAETCSTESLPVEQVRQNLQMVLGPKAEEELPTPQQLFLQTLENP